jgi:hypothetical protein
MALMSSDSLLLKLAPVSRARWPYERRVAVYISTSKHHRIITSGIAPVDLAGTLIHGVSAAMSSVLDLSVQAASTWSLIVLL